MAQHPVSPLPGLRRLHQMSEHHLRQVLPELFGRLLVQVGGTEVAAAIRDAALMPSVVIGSPRSAPADVWSHLTALPVPNAYADAVVLPFTLGQCGAPREVAREAHRVLNDRGRLVIVGLNPWSPWNWRLRWGWSAQRVPVLRSTPSLQRLRDWLELLDFEVSDVLRYTPGWRGLMALRDGEGAWLRRLMQPLQGAYILTARKRVIPMNRLPQSVRQRSRSGLGMPVGEGAAVARLPQRPQ